MEIKAILTESCCSFQIRRIYNANWTIIYSKMDKS